MPSFDVEGAGQAISDISRNDYLRFLREYGDFETNLFSQLDDDSGVSEARRTATQQFGVAQGVDERNRSRFGVAAPEGLARTRNLDETLGEVDVLNRSRLDTAASNDRLAGGLLDIGQGVNQASLSQINRLASIETAEVNASAQRKAANRSRNVGIGAGLLGLAAAAFL